jgi:hypothetical protein
VTCTPLRLALAAALLAAAGAPARAQDAPKPADAEKPAEKPPEAKAGPTADEVKAYVKELDAKLPKMAEEDAVAAVKKLQDWYAALPAEDESRKALMGSLAKCLNLRGKDAVNEATAKALGTCGEDAVPPLRMAVEKLLKQKDFSQGVVAAAIKSLGKIASQKAGDIKFLTDLLKDKDDGVIDFAAQALVGYEKAPGVLRRDIVEELIKSSEGTAGKAEANDNAAKKRWQIFGESVVAALQKLSRQTFQKLPEFRAWLNNKDAGGGKNPQTWKAQDEKDKAESGGAK